MSSPPMVIESCRDGYRLLQKFEWGVAQSDVEREDWHGPSGTCIAVTFASDAPAIQAAAVESQVEQWRIGHPGLNIKITREAEHAL